MEKWLKIDSCHKCSHNIYRSIFNYCIHDKNKEPRKINVNEFIKNFPKWCPLKSVRGKK